MRPVSPTDGMLLVSTGRKITLHVNRDYDTENIKIDALEDVVFIEEGCNCHDMEDESPCQLHARVG